MSRHRSTYYVEYLATQTYAYRLATYVGYHWGAVAVSSAAKVTPNMPVYRMDITMPYDRIGSGSWWTVLYILPAALSVGALMRLIWLCRWTKGCVGLYSRRL